MAAVKNTGVLGVEGHPEIQERLLAYLEGGRLHPALILAGPDPEAKRLVAKSMAKWLLCPARLARKVRTFCGECTTCRRIDKDIHPDVFSLVEEGEDTIKIDTVRELCHQMELTPMEGASKICILDECHRLTTASANAFLKTLEEPGPGRYFFLLTAQPGSLLPTILSRCLQFAFPPQATQTVPDEELESLLRETLETKNPAMLVAKLEDKERALSFLRYLQSRLRAIALTGVGSPLPALSIYDALEKFDGSVQLEGRLRSHANYGLLLEDFLRREFLRG